MRVYLPTTPARLREALASGEVGPAPLTAHAVTDEVRRQWPDGSEEEWEYAALGAAADAAARSWSGDEERRRVVLAADVPRVEESGDDDPTAVVVPDAVPLRLVAAAHGDLTAEDAAAGAELCWFARQEIDQLLAGS